MLNARRCSDADTTGILPGIVQQVSDDRMLVDSTTKATVKYNVLPAHNQRRCNTSMRDRTCHALELRLHFDGCRFAEH